MTQTSVSRLINRLLLTTSLVLALPAAANAVPVLFGGDNVTVNGAPYSGGELPSGAEIVVTGSLLQLQLADGSTISVPQGSSFRVTGEGDTLAIELITGSMRVDSKGTPISISRNGTTISTSEGAFSAFASDTGGLDGRVNSGSATVVAGGETRSFAAGQGYVASNTGISGTFTPPSTQTPQFAQNTGNETNYTPADERGNAGGTPDLLVSTLEELGIGGGNGNGNGNGDGDGNGNGPDPDGPEHVDTTPGVSSGSVSASLGAGTYAIAYAAHDIGLDVRANATGEFNGSGEMNEYAAGSSENLERGTNLTAELAGDELVTIGRWNGGTTGGAYYSAPDFTFGGQEGFHYAIGLQTATPITSGTATYTLAAATAPTFGDGFSAPGTLTGEMAVNFGLITRVGLDLEVDMPGDHVYIIRSTGGVSNVASSEIEISNSGWGSYGPVFYAHLPVADGGRACQRAGMCDAGIRGFLAGDNAEGIGLSYQIGDSGGPSVNSIYGAAYFKGAGVTGGTGPSAGVSSGSITAPLGAGPYTLVVNGGFPADSNITLDGNGALSFYSNSNYAPLPNGAGRGDTAVADLWGNEDVTIGRWNGGTVTGAATSYTQGGTGELFPNLQSIHYAVGTAPVNLPAFGVATYTLQGWTAPTFRDGGTEPGTFSGDLAIAFGFTNPKVGFEFEVDMPGDHVYVLSSPGGVDDVGQSNFIVNMTSGLYPHGSIVRQSGTMTIGSGSAYGRACPTNSNCFASIGGMLSGDGGSSAAITYEIWQSGYTNQNISGAAAFTSNGAEVEVVSGSVGSPYSNGNYTVLDASTSGVNIADNQAVVFGPSGEVHGYGTTGIGTNKVADLGGNSDVTWQRWTGGTMTNSGNPGTDLSGDRSRHIIVGAPMTAFPANATVEYTLAGYTPPAFADNQTAPGTLSGDMSVLWNGFGSKIGLDLDVNMPGDAIYTIATTGGAAVPSTSEITSIATGRFAGFGLPVTFTPQGGGTGAACPNPSCTAGVEAAAFGTGETIGLGYTIGFSSHGVSGSAVFTQAP